MVIGIERIRRTLANLQASERLKTTPYKKIIGKCKRRTLAP
jgi:hypothetical protein